MTSGGSNESRRRYEHLEKAGDYLLSGLCPDLAALGLELNSALELWSGRSACIDYRDGHVFDERMQKQEAPRPLRMLLAAIVLENGEGYGSAKHLMGIIERDAYYIQKWDLGISGSDLGSMHSADDLVYRDLEWRLGRAEPARRDLILRSIEKVDGTMAAALRKRA